MEFKIKYYKDLVSFHIPDQNVLGNILPNTAPAAVSEAEEVARALSVPFGTPRLSEIVRSGEKIVIVTSDITRPVPSKIIIPRLLAAIVSKLKKNRNLLWEKMCIVV